VAAWLSVVPNPEPAAPSPELEEFAGTFLNWLSWGAFIGGAAGLLICALMIVVGRRGRNQVAQEGLMGTVWVFGGLALAGAAATLVNAVNAIAGGGG
jgi:hypothetical protein